MKDRFYEKLTGIIKTKKGNSGFLSRVKYRELLRKVRESKLKTSGKKPDDYQRLKRYDVTKVGDDDRLIFPASDAGSPVRFYVETEEIFDLINQAHLATGHGGRNRLLKELKKKYKNITCEEIMAYLNLCRTCRKKDKVAKKGAERGMIKKNDSRSKIDIIDMQNQPDRGYRFILVYQDVLTKFVQLRPLQNGGPQEVADVLIDVFTTFGVPAFLESQKGSEFCESVVKEACSIWKELELVRPKCQAEEPNETPRDVENILSSWLDSNSTQFWSKSLRFVQFLKNQTHREDINCSPYEAMFDGSEKAAGL